MIELTRSGQPIRCDGCGATVEQVTEPMKHSVPEEIGTVTYGRTDLIYIVCAPLPDGTQPCLDLALLADEAVPGRLDIGIERPVHAACAGRSGLAPQRLTGHDLVPALVRALTPGATSSWWGRSRTAKNDPPPHTITTYQPPTKAGTASMHLMRRLVNWFHGEPRKPLITTAWKQPPTRTAGPAEWGTFPPAAIDTGKVPQSPEEIAEERDFPFPNSPGDQPEATQCREYRAEIEWDTFAAATPEGAAAEMWRSVCVSGGPVVTVTDKATGEAHEVDLYPWSDDE